VKFRIGGPRAATNDMRVYSDSDHAGDKHLWITDESGRRMTSDGKPVKLRSQSGSIIFLNGIPVYWRSSRQCSTSTSAAEAEIYALYDTMLAANQYAWRAEEIGIAVQWPMDIWVDNKQAVSFAGRTCLDSKLGGVFDQRDSRVRELRDANKVRVRWVTRDRNPADILTHCMASGPFNAMVRAINSQLRFSRDHNGQGGI
jgi:hypothetical protein